MLTGHRADNEGMRERERERDMTGWKTEGFLSTCSDQEACIQIVSGSDVL